METLIENPTFQAYVVSAIVLVMNMLTLANNTALSRAGADEVINPEDIVLNKNAKVVGNAGIEKVERYRRAHRNALENIPLFLITGFVLTLTPVPFMAAAILFGIFVFARVVHSFAYMRQKQPFRTASFAVGALVQIALLGFLGFYTFV
ncbi:MAG: MAPEG family protein [Polyangiales bacterium]